MSPEDLMTLRLDLEQLIELHELRHHTAALRERVEDLAWQLVVAERENDRLLAHLGGDLSQETSIKDEMSGSSG